MSSDFIKLLPINVLQANPFQPRDKIHKEELDELVISIRRYGILEPLVVAHTPAGYQIIAGERRWRAAELAGLQEVPVIVKDTTPKGMLEMAIVENVQRVDLSAIERAQAFLQLQRDFHYDNAEIAEKIGKSASYVSNTLKLLTLPDAIKDGLVGNLITEGHARALLSIVDEKDMIDCYKIILKESASVRRAEELSRGYRKQSQLTNYPRSVVIRSDDPQIEAWKKQVGDFFGHKAQVKVARSSRLTRVTLVFNGPPQETQKQLDKILERLG